MKLPRRNFLHLAAGAITLPAASRLVFAQAYLDQGHPPPQHQGGLRLIRCRYSIRPVRRIVRMLIGRLGVKPDIGERSPNNRDL